MEHYKNLSLENIEGEEWRDVVGYEGFYQVSNYGRVKSLERESSICISKCGKEFRYKIKEHINKNAIVKGYLYSHLSVENVKKIYKNHRLVAKAFIPNPNNYPQINHKDEDKTNNHVDNLEWCTSRYNNNYGTRNVRLSISQKNNTKFSKRIKQYDLNGIFVREWESICEAGRYGYDRKAISNICNNELGSYTANGYLWKFSDSDKIITKYINPILRPILCFDLDMNFIKEYESITSACRDLNVDSGAITTCCQNKRKTVHNYIFKYKDNGRKE